VPLPAQKILLRAARFVATVVGPAAPRIQSSHVFHRDLSIADMPRDWIIEGSPQPKVKSIAGSEDGALNAALWECNAGKFKWQFSTDELVHILEGEVLVAEEDGSNERLLKVGDVAYFHAGTASIWTVKTFVRKLAVLRDNKPSFGRRAQRKLDALIAAS